MSRDKSESQIMDRELPLTSNLNGLANESDIYLRSIDKSDWVFLLLFHESGHLVDNQFDFKLAMRLKSEIDKATITFSASERDWFLRQMDNDPKKRIEPLGLTVHHLNILDKILAVVLKSGYIPQYKAHRTSGAQLEKLAQKAGIEGFAVKNGKLVRTNHRNLRNAEVPAEYFLVACVDVFNRSFNKEFGFPPNHRALSYADWEKPSQGVHKKPLEIAERMYARGSSVPGHFFHKYKRHKE